MKVLETNLIHREYILQLNEMEIVQIIKALTFLKLNKKEETEEMIEGMDFKKVNHDNNSDYHMLIDELKFQNEQIEKVTLLLYSFTKLKR